MSFFIGNLINFEMDESAEIETLLQQSLNLDSDNESEWDELEIGSESEYEEIEFPVPPVASSTMNAKSQLLRKKRTSIAKRAGLTFSCARVLRYLKARDTSKKVQKGDFSDKFWVIYF